MATRPLPELPDSQYAPYIDELQEFFATSDIRFGSPEDIFALADRLQDSGTFSDDLSSLVRSVVLRQGGAMPHAQLLEILSLAIAGPELAHSPQQYREPLRQLLTFVSGVMRRPWNVPPSESADIVPFPTDTSTRTSEPTERLPVAVFEQIREAQVREAQTRGAQVEPPSPTIPLPVPELPHPLSEEVSEERFEEARQPAKDASGNEAALPPRLTPFRRNLLLGAAGTIALAAVLIVWLGPHTPAEIFHVGPAPAAPSLPSAKRRPIAQAEASNAEPVAAPGPLVTGPLPGAVPANPSADGEAARPQLGRRSKPAVSAWAYSPPAEPDSPQTASQPAVRPRHATNSRAAASSNSPYSPVSPATSYPSAPKMSEAPAAPIIRRPAQPDPDASIVGDLPADQISSSPSSVAPHFTVSSGVMAAYLIFAPDPEYPAIARIAHIQGQVILQAVVAKDGSVSATRVLRGNRLLRGAAENAVRRWRYRPYRLAGQPIDVATIVTVDFHDAN